MPGPLMTAVAIQGPDFLGRALAVADGVVLVEDAVGTHTLHQDPDVRVFQYEMPDGLAQFVARHVEYRIMHAAGMREGTHPAAVWEQLSSLPRPRIWTAATLLCRPLPSESSFYDSLTQQIWSWLKMKPADRRFPYPLSPRQWDALQRSAYNQTTAENVVDAVERGQL